MYNKRVKGKAERVKNAEGAIVYKEKPIRTLITQGSALNLRAQSFYSTTEEKYESFNKAIDEVKQKYGPVFALKCAYFLSQTIGRRLSPSIIIGSIVPQTVEERKYFTKIVESVMTRPDFIANAMLTYGIRAQKKTKVLSATPTFVRKNFKEAIEKMKPNTLKMRKMRTLDIKLADLIKYLRPKPQTDGISSLYKSIIENTAESKVKAEEHVVAMLSDTKKTEKEKLTYIKKNIGKMPINAFIRNLSQLNDIDDKTAVEITDRLISISEDKNAYRFFNVFDLLIARKFNVKSALSETLEKALNTALNSVLLNYKKSMEQYKSPAILLDISGSMQGDSWNNASKYCAVLSDILASDTTLYPFHTEIVRKPKIIRYLSEGGTITKYRNLMSDTSIVGGGTHVADTINTVYTKNKHDIMFIITDEVTHDDRRKAIVDNIKDIPVVFLNVDASNNAVVMVSENVLRVSGFSSNLIPMLTLLGSERELKALIDSSITL